MPVPKIHIATQQETIEEILRASKRTSQRVPLRWTFVQRRVSGPRRVAPGPLAELVRRGRVSALDQYLLLVAWASGGEHDVHRSSLVWARAIGADDELGSQRVSRNWRVLRDLGLVSTEKKGRKVNAKLLREDGSRQPYRQPARNYLGLPFAYWHAEWYSKLDLAAKAMLLIALSLPDRFPLPTEHAPAWYGISRSTADRGLRTLRRNKLLAVVHEPIKSPLAPKGYTIRNVYTLKRPFGPRGYVSGTRAGSAR